MRKTKEEKRLDQYILALALIEKGVVDLKDTIRDIRTAIREDVENAFKGKKK